MIGVRLSIMMFMEFFVWGAWYVALPIYMTEIDFADSIGNAYSVGPIAAIVSPFILGMIVDRFFATEKVLGILHIIGGIALFCAPMASEGANPSAGLFLGLLLVHMLCYMPTLGLTNTLAFHNMKNQEKEFPVIRVFGTIGWIVAGLIVSRFFDNGKTMQFLRMAGISGIVMGLYSFSLPHTPAPAAGKKVSVSDVLCLDALALLKSRSFMIFMVSSFLICIPLAFYYSIASQFVAAAGIENPVAKMTFGQMSEIIFMLAMPFFFRFLGVKWMLFVGMLAWVLRYGLFSMGAEDGVVWMILGGIMLHGICYDFFFVTGQIYTDKKAPIEIRGQAQGFLVLVTQGAGMLIGAQVFGKLIGRYTVEDVTNWTQFWVFPMVFAAVIMILFAVLFRDDSKKGGESTGAGDAA